MVQLIANTELTKININRRRYIEQSTFYQIDIQINNTYFLNFVAKFI